MHKVFVNILVHSFVSVAPIPSSPADLELIAQLKSKLEYAELRIRVLEERLRLLRIEKYGAGGEKLSQAQMQLFELEPVVSEMIEQAESEHAPVHRSTKKSVKHPGRQELPAIRRTIATLAQEKGTVKDVQSFLRHSRAATTTDVYMQEIPESVRATVNAIHQELRAKPENLAAD